MPRRCAAMDVAVPAAASVAETDVPARLDRLPWARFHWLVIFALGITWILDGLEVTLVGSLSPAIASAHGGLGLRGEEMGWTASAYLAGAVIDGLVVDCVRRLGSTAVAITHDMASARRIGDRAAMLYRGRIIWSGPATSLMDSGNPFVDQFTHGRREGPIQMELRK